MTFDAPAVRFATDQITDPGDFLLEPSVHARTDAGSAQMTISSRLPGSPALARASLGSLLYEFLKVSFLGFGGGIVLAHRAAVERRRWLTEGDFTDALTFCQFMPGPNVVGIAVCVGAKTRGLAGALASFAGFALIPGIVGFALALLYLGQTGIPLVENVLRGISAAAAGLMIATGLRLLRPHRRHVPTLLFAALAFAGLAIARFPLLVVLLTLAPLSVGATMLMRVRT